jgi:hypothetical protein
MTTSDTDLGSGPRPGAPTGRRRPAAGRRVSLVPRGTIAAMIGSFVLAVWALLPIGDLASGGVVIGPVILGLVGAALAATSRQFSVPARVAWAAASILWGAIVPFLTIYAAYAIAAP